MLNSIPLRNVLSLRPKQRLNGISGDGGGGLEIEKVIREFETHIEAGFQLATFQGPLCAEPIEGLAYFVERVDVDKEALQKELGKD